MIFVEQLDWNWIRKEPARHTKASSFQKKNWDIWDATDQKMVPEDGSKSEHVYGLSSQFPWRIAIDWQKKNMLEEAKLNF